MRALGKNLTQDELAKLLEKAGSQEEGSATLDTLCQCMIMGPLKQPGTVTCDASTSVCDSPSIYLQRSACTTLGAIRGPSKGQGRILQGNTVDLGRVRRRYLRVVPCLGSSRAGHPLGDRVAGRDAELRGCALGQSSPRLDARASCFVICIPEVCASSGSLVILSVRSICGDHVCRISKIRLCSRSVDNGDEILAGMY